MSKTKKKPIIYNNNLNYFFFRDEDVIENLNQF